MRDLLSVPSPLRWSLPDTEERRELGLRLRLRLREGCGRGRAQSRCAAWTRYLGAYTSEILRTAGQQTATDMVTDG